MSPLIKLFFKAKGTNACQPCQVRPHFEPYGEMWRTSYRELSGLYGLPIVGVSGVGWLEDGAWKGWKVIGCSLAVDASASIAAQAPYSTEAQSLTIVELSLRQTGPLGTPLIDQLHRRGYNGV